MSLLNCFVLLFAATVIQNEPWGKDADMVEKKTKCHYCPEGFIKSAANAMIRFHQKVISPADGPRSNYIPSSSEYTRQAICKYGFLKGYMLGCDRLMRENDEPWIYPEITNSAGYVLKSDPLK